MPFLQQPNKLALLGLVLFFLIGPILVQSAPLAASSSSPTLSYSENKISMVSAACDSKSNAEVEQAVYANYVYEEWMGCAGIAFARSTDGGLHFSAPISVPGSNQGAWDPALAISSDGSIVYAAFMRAENHQWFPVVAASFDHGETFPQVAYLQPPAAKNWGDRDFIAVAPNGKVYVTWDYGPERTSVSYICTSGGSCAFATGDLNVVIQWSTDQGRTWSKIVPVSPGFPASGGDSAPILVEPSGRIDVLYQGYNITNTKTYSMKPAHTYFTFSSDGGVSWSTPVMVGALKYTMSLAEWWIDGSLGMDSAGNLYATFDTQQGSRSDIGWLSYSTNHGLSWSPLIRVTPDEDNAPHIVEVAGGNSGTAYVGWLSDNSAKGWSMYLRVFSIAKAGWVTPVIVASDKIFGQASVWPGDTFGISSNTNQVVVLSWGSGIVLNAQKPKSQIFATSLNFA